MRSDLKALYIFKQNLLFDSRHPNDKNKINFILEILNQLTLKKCNTLKVQNFKYVNTKFTQ